MSAPWPGYRRHLDDQYPHPVCDPAAAGLPDYADDDSSACDDVDSPRAAEGTGPAELPPDREDGRWRWTSTARPRRSSASASR